MFMAVNTQAEALCMTRNNTFSAPSIDKWKAIADRNNTEVSKWKDEQEMPFLVGLHSRGNG